MTLFSENRRVNMDITNRCPLLCPECQRQVAPWTKKLGGDISIENFKKVISHFNSVNFCGQRSDPIHHPKFLEILKICRDQNINVSVHNASTHKPLKWYVEAFETHPEANWWLALDGKPEDSPKYRVNQDGFKMIEIMKLASKHLKRRPLWQCIKFSFNQHYLDDLNKMANDIGISLLVLESYRWDAVPWLKPEK